MLMRSTREHGWSTWTERVAMVVHHRRLNYVAGSLVRLHILSGHARDHYRLLLRRERKEYGGISRPRSP